MLCTFITWNFERGGASMNNRMQFIHLQFIHLHLSLSICGWLLRLGWHELFWQHFISSSSARKNPEVLALFGKICISGFNMFGMQGGAVDSDESATVLRALLDLIVVISYFSF